MDDKKYSKISTQIIETLDTSIEDICRQEAKLLTLLNQYVSDQEYIIHNDDKYKVVTGENMHLIKQYLQCLEIGLVNSSKKQSSNENTSIKYKECQIQQTPKNCVGWHEDEMEIYNQTKHDPDAKESILINSKQLFNSGLEKNYTEERNINDDTIRNKSTEKNGVIKTFQKLDKNTTLDWTNVLPFPIKQLAGYLMSEYSRVLEMIEKDKDKVETVTKTKLHLKTCSELIEDAKKVLNFMHVKTFLLIGCSGNGKSATGNSILGAHCFETSSSTTSTESRWVYKSRNIKGIKIGVIDGPGVDINSSNDHILKTAAESLKKALELCNYNFTALLIVLKYGSRYTKQEGLTIKLLKGLLGENIIADSGICVFTHGDTFDHDQKGQDSPISFGEWCMEQEGEIKKLFGEFRDRIAIFNNKECKEIENRYQVNKLFLLTEQVKYFSKDDFESSKKEREIFEQENLNIEIKKKIEQRISEIRSKLRSLESKSGCDAVEDLERLENELDKCLDETPSSCKTVRSLVLALILEIQSRRKLIEFNDQNGSTDSTSEKANAESFHTENISQKPKNKFIKFLLFIKRLF